MSDLEITFKLPEELIERAQKVGMALEQQNDRVVAAIDAEVRKREAIAKLNDIAQGLQSLPPELKPTPEEIDAEIRAYWAEKTETGKAS